MDFSGGFGEVPAQKDPSFKKNIVKKAASVEKFTEI